jgi:crotonobetainyl-CoA:carnitine CoA-transferase CaiB-like acyl-CoA transferase
MARILDLTSEVGAYGTRLLAELGHDVVRVETPRGDTLRRLHPHLRSQSDLESSAFHQFLNAGKRSFAVDLGKDEGRRLFLALAATADAVVASLPLRIDENSLHAANSRLALVCIDDGPPELVAYARSGLLAITGEPDASPTLLGGHVPHAAIGLYVAMAAAAALFVGAGQVVDVDATQCLAALAEQVWVEYSMSGELLERMGSTGGITALAGALPCADGHWMVSVPPDPKGWTNFVQLVPDPAFKDDGSLADEALRRERKREILDRIGLWSQDRNKREIVDEAQRLHIPAATVANPLELVDDPQLLARGFLKPVDHPALGRINFPVGALASFFGKGIAFAPQLGQDTASLLSALDYPAAEIDRLARAGIIKTMSASSGDLA